jgi:hypothetical protein
MILSGGWWHPVTEVIYPNFSEEYKFSHIFRFLYSAVPVYRFEIRNSSGSRILAAILYSILCTPYVARATQYVLYTYGTIVPWGCTGTWNTLTLDYCIITAGGGGCALGCPRDSGCRLGRVGLLWVVRLQTFWLLFCWTVSAIWRADLY